MKPFAKVLFAVAVALAAVAAKDAAKVPAAAQRVSDIGVSPRGHYVTYKGDTLMLIGDSGTQCVTQNVNLDYRRWIDECASRGIRAVHVWSFMAPRQKRDGSVIEARYGYVYPGVTPWARKTSGPNATDGLEQWDLTTFDDGADGDFAHYWPRMRDLCAYAKGKNIVVGITAFFGFPKHNRPERPSWSYCPLNVANGGFLTDSKEIVTAPQTIHSPGTEVLRESWSHDWPPAKKTQWVWEKFAHELIRQTKPYGNVFYVFMDEHSYPEGNGGDHFLTFFKRRGAVYVDWQRRRSAVDFVHNDVRSSQGDWNRLAVQAFARKPHRPNISMEYLVGQGLYRGDGMRRGLWCRVIGGHHFLFHNDEDQENVKTGIMVFDPHVRGGKKDKVLQRLDWLGHASRFFNETIQNLDAMAPHNELIGSAKATYCLANPGVEYAVYSLSGKSFALDLSAVAEKTVSTRFYDPRNGQWTDEVQVAGGNKNVFQKPNGEDWVLYARVK